MFEGYDITVGAVVERVYHLIPLCGCSLFYTLVALVSYFVYLIWYTADVDYVATWTLFSIVQAAWIFLAVMLAFSFWFTACGCLKVPITGMFHLGMVLLLVAALSAAAVGLAIDRPTPIAVYFTIAICLTVPLTLVTCCGLSVVKVAVAQHNIDLSSLDEVVEG